MKKTSAILREKKRLGQKISALTGYDYPTARALEEVGIDIILVGDSVGRNILGYASERDVTLADIVHHVRAVRRGATTPYIMADLPYQTYESDAQALESARALAEAGADGVKFEGAFPSVVRHLVTHGIEVCGHLGFEPQHHTEVAVQGKRADDAMRIFRAAQGIEAAGAVFMLLELIPEELGDLISRELGIPTIGIGAGRYTDGQVLVITDLLGYGRNFRHNRRYAEFGSRLRDAIAAYRGDLSAGAFPGPHNASHMPDAELSALRQALEDH